jgi:homogentisate 1,2-dioxygenase
MCDTFHPLKLSKFAQGLDDGQYAYSWYEEPGQTQTYDQDPAGATSHL